MEPATAVAIHGGKNGHFNKHPHNVPCCCSSTLSNQHVADRWAGEADRPGHRHHHRCFVAAEISRGLLGDADQVGSSLTARRRNALAMTLTDESAMAVAAMIGESNIPKKG